MNYWTSHLHFHWRSPFHHHGGPDHHLSTGTYVGRVGTLAVALGIGTATATGFCGACIARAESEDSGFGSLGPSNTSTTQSVNPGISKPSRAGAVPTSDFGSTRSQAAPRAESRVDPASEPRVAAQFRRAPADLLQRSSPSNRQLVADPVATTEIHFTAPDALTTLTTSVAPIVTPRIPVMTGTAPSGGTHSPVVPAALGTVAEVVQSIVPQQPESSVGTASPSVATASLSASAGKVVASLSDIASDVAPTAPADAMVALMAGTVRREKDAALRTTRASAARPVASESSTTTPAIEAEAMAVTPSTVSRSVLDGAASGGYALALSGSGAASTTVTLSASSALTIRAKTNSGSPNMTLLIDGVPVTTVVVSSTSWADYTFAGALSDGSHVLSIASSDATSQSTLYLDKVTSRTGPIGDEFLGQSGSAPNGAIWTAKSGSGWDPGIETYMPRNVYLDGKGRLVIEAAKTKTGYTSGWVESKNKMSFGYGTITARIKVPKGQGLWPAFWLKGADEDVLAWPQSGEIDVLELPSTTTTVYNTLHGPIAGSSTTQQAQIISTLPDLSTDYHNYWVRHLEDEITFGVDDRTLGTFTPESLEPGETWVYNRPMQVILNLAVGGPWAGEPSKSTRFPAKMLVDSVTWEPVQLV